MTLTFDLYFSFRSPYSYLAAQRLSDIVARFDVACRLRPVLPLAVRDQDFYESMHPLAHDYIRIDVARLAQIQGVPIAAPAPDPVAFDADGRPAKDQPRIMSLTRLGVAAEQAGAGLEFVREVSRTIWGGVEGWDEGGHLSEAAARAGLDLDALQTAVGADVDGFDETIRANQRDQNASGHWGVPLMVFDGEPFFGQDRIDALIWRMAQKGLRERAEASEG